MRGGNDAVDAKLLAKLQALFRQYIFSAGADAHIWIAAAHLCDCYAEQRADADVVKFVKRCFMETVLISAVVLCLAV